MNSGGNSRRFLATMAWKCEVEKYGGVNRSEEVETPKSARVLLTFLSFYMKK